MSPVSSRAHRRYGHLQYQIICVTRRVLFTCFLFSHLVGTKKERTRCPRCLRMPGIRDVGMGSTPLAGSVQIETDGGICSINSSEHSRYTDFPFCMLKITKHQYNHEQLLSTMKLFLTNQMTRHEIHMYIVNQANKIYVGNHVGTKSYRKTAGNKPWL